MANETQPESAEKKKREVKVRDLKPKTDATDAKKDDKRASGGTGEADVMKGLN
jgi:hypothetical protein